MCQCANWLRNVYVALSRRRSLAHWHINFQFRPPFQRIWVSVDLYVHFAACCKRDFDFFSYPYVKCVFQIIHLE